MTTFFPKGTARAMVLATLGLLFSSKSFADETHNIDQILTGAFHQRLQAIHHLPADLSKQEVERLLAFLKIPSHQPGIQVLKNDLLNALRSQATPPADLDQVLIEIWQNPSFSLAMRDYAIQHLGAWYEHSQQRELIAKILWQATDSPHSSISGTALLALHRLANRGATINQQKLAQQALAIAKQNINSLATISALRICGERNLQGAASIARSILVNNASVSLQLSALATLGDVGGVEDRELLRQKQAHPRLMVAAESALKKLNQRFADV